MKIALVIIAFVLFALFILVCISRKLEEKRHKEAELKYARERAEEARKVREIHSSRRSRIFLKASAPISFCKYDIIYYEPSYDEEISSFIASRPRHYHLFHYEYYLNYYPERVAGYREVIRYNHPNLSDEQISHFSVETKTNVADLLSPYLVCGDDPHPIEPCLIRVLDDSPVEYEGEQVYLCSYCSLRPTEHYSTEEIFNWYIRNVGDTGARYSIAHDGFSDEIKKLQKEILERMDRLRVMGVDESILRQLALPKVELSPILVTKEYKIVLPAFNRMEIKMEPVQRALYILFLRHPEGILFKDLVDYRKELMEIYSAVSNRSDKNQMEKTVERLTDPTDNSINEKCARIREAFVKEFSDDIARNYYIYGHVMEEKRIALAEEEGMVNFEK